MDNGRKRGRPPRDLPTADNPNGWPLCPRCFEYKEPVVKGAHARRRPEGIKHCIDCDVVVKAKRKAESSKAAIAYNRVKMKKRAAKKRAAKAEEAAKITPEKADAIVDAKSETREEELKREAQRELARRELARRSLLDFITYFDPSYDVGWVHREICETLEQFAEDIIAGRSPHLIISMPPRHGKSMIASEFFPAWFLGRNPQLEVISASYAAPLAMQFSRRVQEIIKDERYKNIFPEVALAKDHQGFEEWATAVDGRKTRRGGYRAAGVGGPITGKGADLFVVDDPVKNRDEAESAIDRASKRNWFTSTAYTRLMPGGGMLIILTRWHDDDLAGWLLASYRDALAEQDKTGKFPEDAIEWSEIRYAAVATEDEAHRKKGEALHPSRFPLRRLNQIKRTLGPRDWSALYQQTPTAEEGEFFKRKSIKYFHDSPPPDLDIYVAADLSISKKESADWSVFVVAALDAKDNIYILHEVRGRFDADEIVDVMFQIQREFKPRAFGVEHGAIWEAIKPHFNKRVREERMYELQIEDLHHKGRDKELRARPIQGRMAQGKVFFPDNALWVPDFVNELLRFPNGVNDDRVDAVAWIGQMLLNKVFIGDTASRRRAEKGWKERLKDYVNKGDRTKSRAYMTA